MFLVISNSIAKRRDGLVLVISTAGSDESELLRGLYDHGKAVESGDVDDPAFLLDWAEADGSLNPNDGPDVRRLMALQANPHAEEFDTLEHVERRWHEIPEHEWRRYFANQWVSVTADSWLPAGAWDACRFHGTRLDPNGGPVVIGVDVGLKHDSTAIVAAQERPDGRLAVEAKIWLPEQVTVDLSEIEAHLRHLHTRYNVTEIAYDPAFFQRSADVLADDGLAMVEVPQSAQRMMPAAQMAYEAICSRRIVHDASDLFSEQVTAAVPRSSGEGWRLSKGRSKRRIDAAIALVLAVQAASQRPVENKNPVFWW